MTTTAIPTAASRPVEIHAGCRFTWHVTADDTGGALSVAEALIPAGAEPPLHVHAREDELFYVLDGEMTFQRGVERVPARPGDSVLLPRGVQHGFAVTSAEARVLLTMSPGRIEAAFRNTSTPAREHQPPAAGPPSPEEVERLLAVFAAHGVEFTGPPLPVLLAQG